MSKVNLQKELEALYSKNQTIPRIYAEFKHCKEYSFSNHIKSLGIDEAFGFALLVQMALHKRCDMATLVGLLRGYASSAQECAGWLFNAVMGDLVDWDGKVRMFIVRFTITDEVQADLDRFQYPLPMVVVPKEIMNNRQSGYLLNNISVILKDNHHEDDVCLDHLNRMNKVKLCINNETARMVQNKWRNLDKAKPGETKDDFNRRKKAFEKFDKTTREVNALVTSEGNEFYLTHRYDKRGRTYCQGYHVSYQGAPWNKSVIEFADGEVTQ